MRAVWKGGLRPIADTGVASHSRYMKWNKALAWAAPVWVGVSAAMITINHYFEAGATLFDLAVALLAAYPLCAFIIKATGDDRARWRVAYGSRNDENGKS